MYHAPYRCVRTRRNRESSTFFCTGPPSTQDATSSQRHYTSHENGTLSAGVDNARAATIHADPRGQSVTSGQLLGRRANVTDGARAAETNGHEITHVDGAYGFASKTIRSRTRRPFPPPHITPHPSAACCTTTDIPGDTVPPCVASTAPRASRVSVCSFVRRCSHESLAPRRFVERTRDGAVATDRGGLSRPVGRRSGHVLTRRDRSTRTSHVDAIKRKYNAPTVPNRFGADNDVAKRSFWNFRSNVHVH